MPKIIDQGQKGENIFQRLFGYIASQDKFTKLFLLTAVLFAIVTPVIATTIFQSKQHAGNDQVSLYFTLHGTTTQVTNPVFAKGQTVLLDLYLDGKTTNITGFDIATALADNNTLVLAQPGVTEGTDARKFTVSLINNWANNRWRYTKINAKSDTIITGPLYLATIPFTALSDGTGTFDFSTDTQVTSAENSVPISVAKYPLNYAVAEATPTPTVPIPSITPNVGGGGLLMRPYSNFIAGSPNGGIGTSVSLSNLNDPFANPVVIRGRVVTSNNWNTETTIGLYFDSALWPDPKSGYYFRNNMNAEVDVSYDPNIVKVGRNGCGFWVNSNGSTCQDDKNAHVVHFYIKNLQNFTGGLVSNFYNVFNNIKDLPFEQLGNTLQNYWAVVNYNGQGAGLFGWISFSSVASPGVSSTLKVTATNFKAAKTVIACCAADTDPTEDLDVSTHDLNFVTSGSKAEITKIEPDHGPVGTTVTIYGNHLYREWITNATPAQITLNGENVYGEMVNGGDSIIANIPADAKTGYLMYSGIAGNTQSPTKFIVTGNDFSPQIAGFYPKSGPPGTIVWIWGYRFGAPGQVLFNQTPAKMSTNSVVVYDQSIVTYNTCWDTSNTYCYWSGSYQNGLTNPNLLWVKVPQGATTGKITLKSIYDEHYFGAWALSGFDPTAKNKPMSYWKSLTQQGQTSSNEDFVVTK